MSFVFPFDNILISLFYVFLFSFFLYSLYFLVVMIFQNIRTYKIYKQQRFQNKLNHEYYIPISILLCTYNNEKTIVQSIRSLCKLHYKLYEIVIIDDGSSDKTISILKNTFSFKKLEKPIYSPLQTEEIKEVYQADIQKIPVTLLVKDHSGKADTLNAGINFSSYPYFVCVDTHYSLEKNALENLIRPVLENDKVYISNGAIVVGSIDKKNRYRMPKGILAKGQITEYSRASLFRGFSSLPSFTLLKKDIVIASLDYDYLDAGENFELIEKIKKYCKMQNIKCISKNAIHAVATIQVPNAPFSLFRQRKNFRKTLYSAFFSIVRGILWIAVFLCFFYKLISISLFCFYFMSYIFFMGCLSAFHFLSQLKFENISISPFDFIRILLSTFIEQTILKFISFLSLLFSLRHKN